MHSTAQVTSTIQQGATYPAAWRRGAYPYPVQLQAGSLVRTDTWQAAAPADFVPVDYTGCTARMQVRPSICSSVVLIEFSSTPAPGQGLIELGSDGWVSLSLSADLTAAIPCGNDGKPQQAIGHLEVTYPDGTVRREYEVCFTISPEVTR